MTVAVENARKSKPAPKSGARKENPFIRYELSKDETARLREARASNPDIWDEVNKLIQEGYKITLTWDEYSNSPACWLFAKSERDPNFGAILSGRGRSIENAVFEVIYKHYVVFQRVWPRSQSKADDVFWDD